ncbi:MAG: phenylalanine--tRNA ligase subunit beta [Acidilobaceae archaeon]|nr:phenylalanine--tRNA ligase subunit beta [Acidilobaceae archaeon]MCX8165041.1 phenylalanine--tRNA ligase subunit beta [Acidilobaceae archaeon]MDW7974442.1 phenylalanine--tRNA ligase subunit beta [Sulfolobales archaeon]
MPVLRFKQWRLSDLTGLSPEELKEALFRLKSESEEAEGYFVVEVNADRPDMFIGEGLARAVRGIMGEEGWREPLSERSGVKVEAEQVPTRPYIVAAVVYGVNVDSEDFLEELIQFQEKLNEGLGRRRKKAAIGFHDLSKLPSREIVYKMDRIDREFQPLGGGRKSIKEVLEETEKGFQYGAIARYGELHPVLEAGHEIIAVPPVLNSELTRVEVGTRDLFIDVTATNLETASVILDVLTSNLAERGGRIGKVLVAGAEYPLLEQKEIRVSEREVVGSLGAKMSLEEAAAVLRRMRYNVDVAGEQLVVKVPPFRVDVFKPIDLAEDIAIYVGYENLGPERPRELYALRGSYDRLSLLERRLRSLLVGMGFTEVMQLSLTSPSLLEAMGLREAAVEVLNPVQIEYSVLRPNIASTMLRMFSEASHVSKPVKVFEIGPVAFRSRSGKVVDEEHLAMAIMDEEVSYEQIQAPLYSALRVLGIEFSARPGESSITMVGRTGELLVRGEVIGFLGEVRPEILISVGLEYPVAVAELNLTLLSKLT